MYTGQVMPLRPLSSDNSSYTITFDGPRVKCWNHALENVTISSTIPTSGKKFMLFNSTWSDQDLQSNISALHFSFVYPKGFLPAPKQLNKTCGPSGGCSYTSYPPENATLSIVLERTTMECHAFTTTYTVDFDYQRGMQHVNYTASSLEPLQFKDDNDFKWNATEHIELPNTTDAYLDWTAELPSWTYKANSRAILDSIGLNIDYRWYGLTGRKPSDLITGTYRLPNGSEAEIGGLQYLTGGETINSMSTKQLVILYSPLTAS
jgi:hypothetical protein